MRKRKHLVKILRYKFPITPRPFKRLTEESGLSEEKVVDELITFLKSGQIRRFGAVLNHKKIGFKVNVLVAWRVSLSSIDRLGKTFSRLSQISHCYQRRSFTNWPYNLYTMIHAKNRKDSYDLVKRLSRHKGIKDYRLLFTLKEYKKAPSII